MNTQDEVAFTLKNMILRLAVKKNQSVKVACLMKRHFGTLFKLVDVVLIFFPIPKYVAVSCSNTNEKICHHNLSSVDILTIMSSNEYKLWTTGPLEYQIIYDFHFYKIFFRSGNRSWKLTWRMDVKYS